METEEIQYPQPPSLPPFLFFFFFFLTSQNINKNPQALLCQQPLTSGVRGLKAPEFLQPNLGASYLVLVINPPSSLRLTSSEARFLGRLLH